VIDLLVAWDWEYDASFVDRLLAGAARCGMRASAARSEEIPERVAAVAAAGACPRVLVDRASDVSADAAALASLAVRLGARVLNDPARVADAIDKATMHLKLMEAGVHVPWTILLAPLPQRCPGELDDLPHVGSPFVIKPSRGGGGDGVVLGASGLTDVLLARSERKDDKYLVQQHVVPVAIADRPAYFRVIHCLGDVHPCFWDPATRLYTPIRADDRDAPWCRDLESVTRVTARVSGMDVFSTELALTAAGTVVSVDYVNDMCDFRPASEAADGVPDAIVDAVVERIVRLASAG